MLFEWMLDLLLKIWLKFCWMFGDIIKSFAQSGSSFVPPQPSPWHILGFQITGFFKRSKYDLITSVISVSCPDWYWGQYPKLQHTGTV